MHNLNKAARYCMKELDKMGIPYQKSVRFEVNTTALSRWGRFEPGRSGGTISISAILLDDRVPYRSLEQTVMHELLHTVPGCLNHGAKWKCLAERVNERLGFAISRTSSAEDLGLPAELALVQEVRREMREPYRYLLRCRQCGHEGYYKRRSRAITHPEFYRCSICGGDLDAYAMNPPRYDLPEENIFDPEKVTNPDK